MTLFGFIMMLIERNTIGIARTAGGAALLYGAYRVIVYACNLSDIYIGLTIWCTVIALGLSVLGAGGLVTGVSKLFNWD